MLEVNEGITRASTAIAITVPSSAFAPCSLNSTTWSLRASRISEIPTTPLHTIMITAKMLSRANVSAGAEPEVMRVMINDTSMTVTASASTKVP